MQATQQVHEQKGEQESPIHCGAESTVLIIAESSGENSMTSAHDTTLSSNTYIKNIIEKNFILANIHCLI